MTPEQFRAHCRKILYTHWEELGEGIEQVDFYFSSRGNHHIFAVMSLFGRERDAWSYQYVPSKDQTFASPGAPQEFLDRFFGRIIRPCVPKDICQQSNPTFTVVKPSFHELAAVLEEEA